MSTLPITEEEKASIRHHLGFLGVSAVSTFELGTPAATETQFIMEGSWTKLLDSSLPLMRRYLCALDKIECQMIDDLDLLATEKIDEITVRKDEHARLRDEYRYWQASLANLFGLYPNPFDKRLGAIGGINVGVSH